MDVWAQLVKEFAKMDGAGARKGRSVHVAVGWDGREAGGLLGRRTDGQQGEKMDKEESWLHLLTAW